jgi:hypothetical protein
MIRIADVAKETGLPTLEISREIESIGFRSKRIGRRFFITQEQKDAILLSLYFKLKIEFITLQSKMNYEN